MHEAKKLTLALFGCLIGAAAISKAEKAEEQKKKEEEEMLFKRQQSEKEREREIAKEKADEIIHCERMIKASKAGIERAKVNYEKRKDEMWLDIKAEYEADLANYEAELERLTA